jgi:hypothetical protein
MWLVGAPTRRGSRAGGREIGVIAYRARRPKAPSKLTKNGGYVPCGSWHPFGRTLPSDEPDGDGQGARAQPFRRRLPRARIREGRAHPRRLQDPGRRGQGAHGRLSSHDRDRSCQRGGGPGAVARVNGARLAATKTDEAAADAGADSRPPRRRERRSERKLRRDQLSRRRRPPQHKRVLPPRHRGRGTVRGRGDPAAENVAPIAAVTDPLIAHRACLWRGRAYEAPRARQGHARG